MGTAELSSGRFYGEVQGPRETAALRLSLLRHAVRREHPEHVHERPLLSLLLAGDYREADRRSAVSYEPLTVGWRPAGAPHSDAVGPTGARFLMIELGTPLSAMLDPAHGGARPRHEDGRGELVWLCLRLLREHRLGTAASDLVLDSLGAELVGAINGDTARVPAAWLRKIEDALRDAFPDKLSLGELAASVRVHPVALARAFRRAHGVSIGGYLQRERIRRACARLLHGDTELIDLAQDCGFTDQSHFTKVFRRVTGTTPALFRASRFRS